MNLQCSIFIIKHAFPVIDIHILHVILSINPWARYCDSIQVSWFYLKTFKWHYCKAATRINQTCKSLKIIANRCSSKLICMSIQDKKKTFVTAWYCGWLWILCVPGWWWAISEGTGVISFLKKIDYLWIRTCVVNFICSSHVEWTAHTTISWIWGKDCGTWNGNSFPFTIP